jgi:hypothetical membrane protein
MLIPLFGIFSVIFYFFHVILGEIFYKGYNPLAQAISDLSASNSPSKGIARIFSMLYGISALLFSIGLFFDREFIFQQFHRVCFCSVIIYLRTWSTKLSISFSAESDRLHHARD